MIDPKDNSPKTMPFDSIEDDVIIEDDAIIDLVDEIDTDAAAAPISALEQQLLGIPGTPGRQTAPSAPAADVLDLSGIRFDEDDEALPAAPTPMGTADTEGESVSLLDAKRALARGAGTAGGSANDIEEIAEFDEQFLDPEDILDATPAAKDEPLELLDIEEAELDNELLRFDDLLKGDLPGAVAPAEETEPEEIDPEEIELLLPEDADLGPTSAADVFAAHLDSVLAEGSGAPTHPAENGIVVPFPADDSSPVTPRTSPLAAIVAAVASTATPAAGAEVPAESPHPAPPQPSYPSPEEIEAAVERVIERKLGGTVEDAIRRAIETAVSREIERLKRLLLEDETP
ncbi:MAG: hypothetical protein MUE48_10765 [Desulfobacterales bacterium]|nr:hypothetical protein [Desulfobacterales bacterium]